MAFVSNSDRVVCATSAYHHWRFEFKSRSGGVYSIPHY